MRFAGQVRSVLVMTLLVTFAPSIRADDSPSIASSPPPHEVFTPSIAWFGLQLIPSPSVYVPENGARFGLRWQVTALSYSYGIHRRARAFRSLAVPPIARHAGSIELYGGPDLVFGGEHISDTLLLRGGVRSFVALLDRGEYLSASVGTSIVSFRHTFGPSLELGLYTLGLVGLEIGLVPTEEIRMLQFTLSLRPF